MAVFAIRQYARLDRSGAGVKEGRRPPPQAARSVLDAGVNAGHSQLFGNSLPSKIPSGIQLNGH
jgi:hypothetical protein